MINSIVIAIGLVVAIPGAIPGGTAASVEQAAKAVPAARAQEAWTQAGLTGCSPKAPSLSWLACQFAAIEASPPATAGAKVAVARDSLAAAAAVAAMRDDSGNADFRMQRFQAHHRACSAALQTLRLLEPQRSTAKPAIAAEEVASLHKSACGCVEGALQSGVAANASSAQQAAVQGLATVHQCFADKPLSTDRQSGPAAALLAGIDGKQVMQANDAVRGYALARSLDVKRCRDKLDDGADNTKVETCVCGAVKKWKMPLKSGTARVPLVDDGLTIELTTDAAGIVTTCQGMTGTALKR